MADLKVAIELAVQGGQVSARQIDQVGQSLNQLDGHATRSNTSLFSVEKALGAVGRMAAGAALAGIGALVGGVAAATVTAAEFEKTMSAVKAVTGASAEDMSQLSALALQLGQDTSFSAKEAAEGLGELAKGGVSVADIMGGAAAASLNLAAAGSVSVADAAALAANAMAVFNKRGDEMGSVVDQIAGFANATTGSVNDFKFSLAAVGSVAALMGQEFDQTATAIALMGKAGLLGSDAGTSLKAMLNNLVPSTKSATEAMQALGIITEEGSNQFLDAEGNFKDLRDIAGILSTSLEGLSESQRATALETIFLSDGMRAATLIAAAGTEGFDEMAGAMNKVSAAAVAKERLDNLSGSVEQLTGSVSTAAIMFGSELTPSIKEAADWATKFLNDDVIPWIKEYGPGLGRQARDAATAFGLFMEAMRPIWTIGGPAVRLAVDEIGRSIDQAIQVTYLIITAFRDLWTTLTNMDEEARRAAGALGNALLEGIKSVLTPGALANHVRQVVGSAIQAGIQAAQGALPTNPFSSPRIIRQGIDELDELAVALDTVETQLEETGQAAVTTSGQFDYSITNIIERGKAGEAQLLALATAANQANAAIAATPSPPASGGYIGAQAGNGGQSSATFTPAATSWYGMGNYNASTGQWGPPHAMGGPVMGGTNYLVGERGPEIFTAPSNGYIVPNHQMGGGGGSERPIVIENRIYLDGAEIARNTRYHDARHDAANVPGGVGGI